MRTLFWMSVDVGAIFVSVSPFRGLAVNTTSRLRVSDPDEDDVLLAATVGDDNLAPGSMWTVCVGCGGSGGFSVFVSSGSGLRRPHERLRASATRGGNVKV